MDIPVKTETPKFTKGEWLRDGTTVYALDDAEVYYRAGKQMLTNRFTCQVQGFDRRISPEEREASAALIAAAPDLYAALDLMVSERVEYMTTNHLGDPEAQHVIKQARTALSKASGSAR